MKPILHSKSTFAVAIIAVCSSLCAQGQDTVVTLKGETLPVKVIEVDYSKNLVKFKKNAHLNGPLYSEYLDNLFAIKLSNGTPFYNDPWENPYPDYRSVVPISMKRLERYSDAERAVDRQLSLEVFAHTRSLDHGQHSDSEQRFKEIFDKVLDATKQYCSTRKFSIADDFVWEYVYLECTPTTGSKCSIHSQSEHLSGHLNNALSLGNGKFLFSEFFFDNLSDDIIAGIIGHEIGHALAQHSLEKHRKLENLEKISHWAAVGLSVGHGYDYHGTRNNLKFFGENFLFNPYSQKHEKEADRIGAVLMTLAGYDVKEIIKYWRTGEKATQTQFWTTHPGGIERANAIESFVNSTEFQLNTLKR
ncbi:MAG: M48 family metalloprotease [Flavobacteriales bacterium]|nr:M48 family metalloprotease [Flavobacteriales bacterium]